MPEPAWRREDEDPDYRFSLANERTFLAWIRTALALLAGAVAIDQLTPGLAPEPVRAALAVVLALGGALLGTAAYRRWAAVERAMRAGRALPHTPVLLVCTVCVVVAAVVFSVLIVGSGW
ncbi:YidH family protein [Kitasatospora sp. NPDC006697]|uniref:YidH family protein n=1 Tax=Kitasatospora sp. NPDC006697 TaxID=3364020 RepID=UPI0036913E6A